MPDSVNRPNETLLIDADLAKAQQAYRRTRVWQVLCPQDGHGGSAVPEKVQVTIDRDFYDFQCVYVASVWRPEGWVRVTSIDPHTVSEAPSTSRFGDQAVLDFVETMERRLLDDATRVLSA